MKNRKYLLIALIFLLALLVSWKKYLPAHMHTEKHAHISINQDTPDSYMSDITFYQFSRNGKLQQKMISTSAVHYNKHNAFSYKNPEIIVFPESGGTWHITSDRGQSVDGTQTIELINNVVIHRNESEHNPQMTACMDSLKAFPQNNSLETDKEVTITQPHITITGIGLTGNLTTGELKMLSHTKTTYSPKV